MSGLDREEAAPPPIKSCNTGTSADSASDVTAVNHTGLELIVTLVLKKMWVENVIKSVSLYHSPVHAGEGRFVARLEE